MTANSGSHGRMADEIGELLLQEGHEQFIAYGRKANDSRSVLIKIGTKSDMALHLAKTRLFDRHGFGSFKATKSFIDKIDKIDPDLIHLHNIHGYYLNIELLFKYLKEGNKPVVWTFHDCWPFTGHCSHFQRVNCFKWQTECHHCPNIHAYPKSWFLDLSQKNYHDKKNLFAGIKNMVLVSPSAWLAGHLRNSFLLDYEIMIINNGVDLNKFIPVDAGPVRASYHINRKYILGVASTWTSQKGLGDFLALRKILDPEIDIVLVGLSGKQLNALDPGITGISRTENTDELAMLYAGAEVFVNPTYVDNFPSVNLEALACGTPVITYDTGGSAEAIDAATGECVEKGNIKALLQAIKEVTGSDRKYNATQCRNRAASMFSAKERYGDYLGLYHEKLYNHET